MFDFRKKISGSLGYHNLIQHQEHESRITNHESAVKHVDVTSFNKVINFCLYALVFLAPFIFSSLTTENREFNKQALLFFGVVVMLGAWVIKILTTRKISWIKTSLDYIL